ARASPPAVSVLLMTSAISASGMRPAPAASASATIFEPRPEMRMPIRFTPPPPLNSPLTVSASPRPSRAPLHGVPDIRGCNSPGHFLLLTVRLRRLAAARRLLAVNGPIYYPGDGSAPPTR